MKMFYKAAFDFYQFENQKKNVVREKFVDWLFCSNLYCPSENLNTFVGRKEKTTL